MNLIIVFLTLLSFDEVTKSLPSFSHSLEMGFPDIMLPLHCMSSEFPDAEGVAERTYGLWTKTDLGLNRSYTIILSHDFLIYKIR